MKKFSLLSPLLILSALGALLSAYLVWHQMYLEAGLQRGPSFCAFSSAFDCDRVALSKFSSLWGYPVASYSLAYYLVLFAFSALVRRKAQEHAQTISDVALFYVMLGAVPTLVFAVISGLLLKTICLFCALLYLISVCLLILCLRNPMRSKPLHLSLLNGLSLSLRYFLPVLPFPIPLGKTQRLRWLSLLGASSLLLCSLALPRLLTEMVFKPRAQLVQQALYSPEFLASWQKAPVEILKISPADAAQPDYALGDSAAPITIVEFSDYQCPHCQLASHWVTELMDRYQGKIKFIFKNYPLDQNCNPLITQPGHQFACRSAAMARCAGAQRVELFWAMNEAIFSLGDNFSEESLTNLPPELGIDLQRFNECLDSEDVRNKVKSDIAEGNQLKLRGTPTFFINGKRVEGPLPETLHQVIQHLLLP